jgi:hypothetical protein
MFLVPTFAAQQWQHAWPYVSISVSESTRLDDFSDDRRHGKVSILKLLWVNLIFYSVYCKQNQKPRYKYAIQNLYVVWTRWTTGENGEGIGIKWKTGLAAQISDMNSSIFPIVLAQVRSIFILLSPVGYETHSSIQFLHPVNPSTLQTLFACREASLN